MKRRLCFAILCQFLIGQLLFAQTPGTQKWVFTAGSLVHSTPAIGADGVIYVGSNDHKLYAINPDGSQKWAVEMNEIVSSSPAIDAYGVIYVGSLDNKLYAINPDGSQRWAFRTGGDVSSSPAIGADGVIYVGSEDKKLYAINPDGSQKWAFTSEHWVHSSPAIGPDGVIYVGGYDHKLYAINPDGSQKWAFKMVWTVESSPAIGADGVIYVGSGSNLYAINPDGSQKWNFTTGGSIYSSPAIGTDGVIYVGSSDNKLYAINPAGSQKWAFSMGGWVESSPAIGADGVIYVGSRDNNLYAINPNGSQKWTVTTDYEITSSPSIGADGVIYVGSWDRKLYAIYSSSKGLADSPWPKFHQNNFNRGCYPCLSISDVVKFSFVNPGASLSHAFTIGNSFLEDITVSQITFSHPSFSLTDNLPQVIASGSSKILTVSIANVTHGLFQSRCDVTYQKGGHANTMSDALAGEGIFIEDGSELSVTAHRAMVAYDSCRLKAANSPATFSNLGVLYRLLGEQVIAEGILFSTLSAALNAKYGYTGIMMNMGVVKSDKQLSTSAIEFYNAVLNDVSSTENQSSLAPQIYYNIAWEAYAGNNLSETTEEVNKTIAHNMANSCLKAKAYILRGAVQFRQGNGSEAKSDFEQAIALSSDCPPIRQMAEENLQIIATALPDIAADPTSWDYGLVRVRASSDKSLVISNAGLLILNVTSTTLTGTNASEFGILSGGGAFVLAPNGTRNVIVRFSPTSVGTKSASLMIKSDDPDENPFMIDLTATGAEPDIASNSTELNYGAIKVGDFLDKTAVISNVGNTNLNISATTLTGTNASEFIVQSGGGEFALAPGVDWNIVVRFSPTSIGDKSASLSISNDDLDENPFIVSLSGQATPASGVADAAVLVPTEFALLPSYPNPFNPETTISFGLPKASKVELVILNVLGKKVRTIVSEQYVAGWHRVLWDGINELGQPVDSGVYLLLMKAEDFKATRKITLLR